MKRDFLLPLGLLFAALVLLATVVWVKSERREKLAIKYVFVPVQNVEEGTVLKRDFIKVIPARSSSVQTDAFIYTTDDDFETIENAVARVRIPKGSQIRKSAVLISSDQR